MQDGDVLAKHASGIHTEGAVSTPLALKDVDGFRAESVVDALYAIQAEVARVLALAETAFP
jgi:hypothetical protein